MVVKVRYNTRNLGRLRWLGEASRSGRNDILVVCVGVCSVQSETMLDEVAGWKQKLVGVGSNIASTARLELLIVVVSFVVISCWWSSR